MSELNEDAFVIASFHTRSKYVQMLKDYAYSERLTIKEVLDEASEQYFKEHKPRLHKES